MQGHLMTLAAVLAASLSASLVLAQDSPPADSPAADMPAADPQQVGPGQAGKLDRKDQDFLNEAAAGGLFEVQAGQLAITKGTSDSVKSFGKRMVEDHTKLNTQIADLAQKKGAMIPHELDKKHKDEIDKLNKKGGADFDREYASLMVSDHQKDYDAFEKASKNAKDPEVKALAASALPTLRDHLDLAKSMAAAVKKEK